MSDRRGTSDGGATRAPAAAGAASRAGTGGGARLPASALALRRLDARAVMSACAGGRFAAAARASALRAGLGFESVLGRVAAAAGEAAPQEGAGDHLAALRGAMVDARARPSLAAPAVSIAAGAAAEAAAAVLGREAMRPALAGARAALSEHYEDCLRELHATGGAGHSGMRKAGESHGRVDAGDRGRPDPERDELRALYRMLRDVAAAGPAVTDSSEGSHAHAGDTFGAGDPSAPTLENAAYTGTRAAAKAVLALMTRL